MNYSVYRFKLLFIALGVLFFFNFTLSTARAQTQPVAQCDAMKDSKRKSECYEILAQAVSEKKGNDSEISSFISRAKQEAARNLIDPESANFRDLLLTKNKVGRSLCGQMNAKNRAGGYVGYRRFVISFSNSDNSFKAPSFEELTAPKTEFEKISVELFELIWKNNCVDFPVIWKASN